jgi:hypothetical protein
VRAYTPSDIPILYKLHGSLNWTLEEDKTGKTINARSDWPETWAQFAQELEYIRKEREGYQRNPQWRPPVLLPYWDKRIEGGVWLKMWKKAAEHLRRTNILIIWGYSLPTTDLKARELLTLAFPRGEDKPNKVVVIDPSRETQDRWRRMFLGKTFFRFSSSPEFQRFKSGRGGSLLF